MAEPYETPPSMQDIYDKDKERYSESDELIREGDLKGAADVHPDKKLLGTDLLNSIEGGVTGSIQWLQKQAEENPDTYTDDVLRLLGGGLKNTAWAISKIPLLDKLAQGEDWLAGQARALNEQLTPWLDPRFAGWGTRIGTGILADKGIRKAVSGVQRGVRVSQALSKADEIMAARKNPALANVLMKQIDGDDIPLSQRVTDAYKRNKEVIQEGRSLRTGTQLDFTDVTKANERTLKKMGLWDYQSIFSMDELDGIITRTQAKGIVTPDIPGFTKAQAERLGRIEELKSFYKNLTIDQIIPELDHKTPLKLSAYLMDKTTGAKRVAIRKVILDEGIYLAEMVENMQALPREVHAIWTRNMNKYLGKTHKNFQDTFLAEMSTLGITDPLDIAKEFARRIKAARETFDVAFDAHKITYGTEWTDNIDDMVNKLDEAFEAGDEWAPRRTNEAVSRINESLSDLDEVPFSNEAAEDLIRRFNLDNKDVHTLKELQNKPMAEQVKFLKKHTGMTIGELNDMLSQWNMSISDLLNLLDN